MEVIQYQDLAARTINPALTHKQMQDHALKGMVGEIGEINEFDEEHVKKELGDLMWFVAEYCTGWGWNLDDICQMNIDKLRARFPDGFEVDKSIHRAEGDI